MNNINDMLLFYVFSTALIYPCICTRSNDEGIFITCENSNLASLSIAFINIASTNLPIEDLIIEKCKISEYCLFMHNMWRYFLIFFSLLSYIIIIAKLM